MSGEKCLFLTDACIVPLNQIEPSQASCSGFLLYSLPISDVC